MSLSPEFRVEIVERLRRSGYLLESRIVRSLSEQRFFVEPNIAVTDKRTGKARELDVLAEYFDHDPDRPNTDVKTHFVMEAINNTLPLVLMTPRPWSPNEDLEDCLRYAVTPDRSTFLGHFDLYEDKVGFKTTRYSQYCALSRKKSGDELMASHPEDLYSSLLKLAEFVEQELTNFRQEESLTADSFWRLWFWQPILVLGGDLLVAADGPGGELEVTEVHHGKLIFNFHSSDHPQSVLIEVVREQQLLPLLTGIVGVDDGLKSRLYALRLAKNANAT